MSGHGHSHGACEHEHEPESDIFDGWSLYKYIDTSGVTCLNESIPGSVNNCFKSYEDRCSTDSYLESNDDDEQLIIHIPFTGAVKITNICIIGGTNGSSPSLLKVWKNRDDIDFSCADDIVPLQQWDLQEDREGELHYTTKISRFQNISTLTLYFPENFGEDFTRIYYIGLKGEFFNVKREAVNVVYESRAQLKDHKTGADNGPISKQIQ